MAPLSRADYEGVLRVLALAGDDEGDDPFPPNVLEELRRLVPCDTVSYGEYDPDRRGWRTQPRWVGEPAAPVTRAIKEAFHALRDQYVHRPEDQARVLRWSDRLSRRAMRRLAIYQEVVRPLRCEYALTAWLVNGREVIGSFSFDRSRRDFAARDVRVLEVLYPHLVRLALAPRREWSPRTEALTSREREIIGFVARGYSNAEVARQLHLSPGTVRKHLENIYPKLGVSNRTAAARTAYELQRGSRPGFPVVFG